MKRIDSVLIQAGLAAVAMRALMYFLVTPRLDTGDASSYLLAAQNLINVQTLSYDSVEPFLPTAYRPPLYPAYLAAVLAVVRQNVDAARALLGLFSVVNVFLVASIAKRLAPGSRTAATWLTALNPFDAVYGVAVLSESLTSSLLLATAWVLSRASSLPRLVLAGVLLGLSCLARDIYVALVPFAALLWVLFARFEPLRMRLRQAVIVAMVSGLTVLPWSVRNFAQFGKFIPVSAGRLGFSLWVGTWAVTGGDVTPPAPGHKFSAKAYLLESEAREVDPAVDVVATSEPVFKRLFAERFKAEPAAVIFRWVKRVPMLWVGTRFDIFLLSEPLLPMGSLQWKMLKVAFFAMNLAILLAGLIGVVLSLRRRLALAWLSIPIVFTALIYFPLNGFENRYSMPVYDFVVMFAALAMSAALARRRALN